MPSLPEGCRLAAARGAEPFPNFRKTGPGGGFSRLYQLRPAAEGIPIHSADIRSDDQIGFAPPAILERLCRIWKQRLTTWNMLLGVAEGWRGQRTEIRAWRRVGAPRPPEPQRHGAIHQEPPLVAYRLKQSRIGATGANGIEHFAGPAKAAGSPLARSVATTPSGMRISSNR